MASRPATGANQPAYKAEKPQAREAKSELAPPEAKRSINKRKLNSLRAANQRRYKLSPAQTCLIAYDTAGRNLDFTPIDFLLLFNDRPKCIGLTNGVNLGHFSPKHLI